MPSAKTVRTLSLMDALLGIERVNLNPALLAENERHWRTLSDAWVADPCVSSAPKLWDGQATFEWALKQPDAIFKPKPLQGWFVREVDGRIEYVALGPTEVTVP